MVNRIWKHHFGRGLVRTLGNFGKTGERPTHPELLDWLALNFIREGYSLKAMHRLMMTSSTYMQSSATTAQMEQLDPDNRLLSRMPLRRMEAEVLRDTLLLVAGELDESRYGPADPVRVLASGLVHSGKRRSIYVQQLRKQPATLLESFDLPAMNPNCLERSESLVAPQALQLLNDPAVQELAERFADRVLREAGGDSSLQVQRSWLIAYGRLPNEAEQEACLQTLSELTTSWTKELTISGNPSAGDAERRARIALCHTIMNAAPFLYID
jgi:hypothetical protein